MVIDENRGLRHRPACWAFFLLVCAAGIARLALLNQPFISNHEATATGPMVCPAQNFARYGPLASGFAMVLNTGEVPRENWVIYSHHPPLVPLMIAGMEITFGRADWAVRLPSAVFSVMGTALLFWMMNRRFGWRVALACGIVHAFSPFAWLFAGMPDVVGPHVVFFGLATIASYSLWFDTRHTRWLWAMGGAFILAALCNWAIFFVVPTIALHYVLTHNWRTWWWPAAFCFGGVMVFLSLMIWAETVGTDKIFQQIIHRITAGPDHSEEKITLRAWVKHVLVTHLSQLHTPVIMALGGVYLLWVASRIVFWWKRADLKQHDIPLMILWWGVLHEVVPAQSSYQHAWVAVVLSPGLAVAAVLGLRVILYCLPKMIREARWVEWSGVTAAVLFVGYSYHKADVFAHDEFNDADRNGYTLKDLGRVIFYTAEPTDGVLTSDISDKNTLWSEPALWYYADRQLRQGITTVERLNESLDSGPYNLYYLYEQPDGPPPKWFVMPAPHYFKYQDLAGELDSRYERWVIDGFLVYYLGEPAATQPDSATESTTAPLVPTPDSPGEE